MAVPDVGRPIRAAARSPARAYRWRVLFSRAKTQLPTPEQALQGRADYPYEVPPTHVVTGNSLLPPFPAGLLTAVFALGCFWGEEKAFWQVPGVWSTAVGYTGGSTPYPTYEEVCSGRTGHAEAVLVVFDPEQVSYEQLLQVFWEAHDPTQGMRQGNDVGTQYRSAVYYASEEQRVAAEASLAAYQQKLTDAGYGTITTTVEPVGPFYYAEPYHQQYLVKNPYGYCPDNGTGVSCPVGLFSKTEQSD
jgi:peptide-methionine (S)-S-oxide reductase